MSVAFSQDRKQVVFGTLDGTILVRDVHTGIIIAGPFGGHASSVTTVQFFTGRQASHLWIR